MYFICLFFLGAYKLLSRSDDQLNTSNQSTEHSIYLQQIDKEKYQHDNYHHHYYQQQQSVISNSHLYDDHNNEGENKMLFDSLNTFWLISIQH
ncbi:unnamed protein product [Heterobilharzia americana]|nr:unnamed protein product [Heterobilharzia americana]